MRGRNDWGVPDWLDAAQYPTHAAGVAWAWEFLRRSPAYRQFWTEEVLPFVRADGSIDYDASVGKYRQAGPDGETSWGVFKEAKDRFGLLTGPVDPGDPDSRSLFMDGAAIRQARGSRFHPEQTIALARNEATYIIDLERPLDPQLERVRRAAKSAQAHLEQTGEIEIAGVRRGRTGTLHICA